MAAGAGIAERIHLSLLLDGRGVPGGQKI